MNKRFFSKVLLLLMTPSFTLLSGPPMLTQNDFLPMHSTLYPFDFLNARLKEYEKGLATNTIHERMRLSVTPFAQSAKSAKNQDKETVNTGDYRGRWNMLGLLYGSVPTGQTRAALLTTAAAETYQDGQRLDHPNYSDVNDNLGHFSIPLRYRKLGARFEFSARLVEDLVIRLEGGIADIRQVYSTFENKGHTDITIAKEDVYGGSAPSGVDANLVTDRETVADAVMDTHQLIFEQMGLNIQDTQATGAEDVFVSLIWRHDVHVNNMRNNDDSHDYTYEDEDEWAPFIITPFFKITGIVGIGKKQNTSKAFSMPFGNNGHHGVSVTTGFSLDFYESIEASWEAGTSHFFEREISGLYVPTDERQTGVFPFKTDVKYDPGKTWFFSCGVNAYHLIDKLSCSVQYLFTTHSKDSIKLITADTAFKPHVLEDQTKWTVQSANVMFNYDLSPHMTIGCAWQAPVGRRGAYKTNTVAVTIAGTF